MKRSIFIFFLLVLSSALSARNVSGNVRCGKRGISGVVVTDGKNFAVTSADGKYALEADENAYFVYIVVPSGYNPPFGSGTPLFYKKFKEGKNIYDFKLKKSASRDSYTLLAFADSHIRTERGLKRFRSEIVSDMDSLSKIYIAKGNTAIAGIALGDLAWDKLESLGKYKKAVSKLSYPCYPVIGNHDHDKAVSDDGLAARQYRDKFGPTYYAFNLGHDYYVVLDDVLYHGDRKYDNLISGEQLEWLEGYLKYVPKGSHVIIAMHIPYLIKFKNLKVKGHERLVGMLRDYKVNFMSGHTHVLGTYEARARDNRVQHSRRMRGHGGWGTIALTVHHWDTKSSNQKEENFPGITKPRGVTVTSKWNFMTEVKWMTIGNMSCLPRCGDGIPSGRWNGTRTENLWETWSSAAK
jgi:hypothetical protein